MFYYSYLFMRKTISDCLRISGIYIIFNVRLTLKVFAGRFGISINGNSGGRGFIFGSMGLHCVAEQCGEDPSAFVYCDWRFALVVDHENMSFVLNVIYNANIYI